MTDPPTEDPPPPRPAAGALDFIGENLRRMFGAVEAEPMPDRFKELLRKLAEADRDKP